MGKEKDQPDDTREATQNTKLEDKCKQASEEVGVIFQVESNIPNRDLPSKVSELETKLKGKEDQLQNATDPRKNSCNALSKEKKNSEEGATNAERCIEKG